MIHFFGFSDQASIHCLVCLSDCGQLGQIVLDQQIQRLDRPQHRNKLIEAARDLIKKAYFDFIEVDGDALLRLFQLLARAVEEREVKGRLPRLLLKVLCWNYFIALFQQRHVD